MASYFHVALTGPAQTWLMNLTPGSVYFWEELCARFIANFASAYHQHGVEAHLHVVRQEPEETLWAFIARFTKVRGTIPRVSDASIITHPCRKAVIMEASKTRGIVPHTLVKRAMKTLRVSPGSCLTAWR